ncbi:flagellar biosynthesis anti-sigma factor FlgM [Rhodothermus bifroesti]|uniref:Anti-sigma-28 factor FlgM C-terminal domain-containing protein n=1 Tax=Rhodothermus marinus TaxID=29549 RepID=A0A7V2F6K8_RHOMR|nr:flagellar biosynthesis anti-sigma factor FlgM [Rhodothermus bifroesti]GBD01327.1 hypothetical protein HRbin18_01048 [bacterium HR18]
MDIRDIKGGGAHRLDPLQREALSTARRIDEGDRPSTTPQAPEGSAVEDRVELSEAARKAAQQANETPAIEFAREALRSTPSLSPERVAAILRSLQAGYYMQPEVIKQIAQRLVEEMLAENLVPPMK